jgi:SRSO17 transposase
MAGVHKLFDPVDKTYTKGHSFVTAVISFRGFVIPFAISFYVKKELCKGLKVSFKTKTKLSAEIISEFEVPEGINVTVLFDTYYLCGHVLKSCKKKGFHWVSYLKSNRNITKNGRKLKAGKYAKNLFYRISKSSLTINDENKTVNYQFINAGVMKVSKVGDVRIIVSRKNKNKKILALVTDIIDLPASEIIKTYAKRWTIEVFFKESKQQLGLGQYQNRFYRAAVTHLHLVCFSYALLTHMQIMQCAKGKRKKEKVVNDSKMSTASMQNELRLLVWDDFVEYLYELKRKKKDKFTGDFVIEILENILT